MKSNQINTNKMKIKHLFLSALAVAMVAVGCKKEEGGNNGAPSITLDPETIEFAVGETDSKTVTVTANREWKIETVKDAWLTVEKVSETEAKVTVSEKNTGTDRTATVSFRVTGKKAELKVIQKGEGGAVTPVEEGDGTKEKPYSASQALGLAKALKENSYSDKEVYVRGKINEIKELSTTYGNATFWISNDGSADNKLYVFQMYDFGGAKFSDESKLKIADDVVVYGKLQNYKGESPQISRGGQLVSLNGDGPKELSAEGVVVALSKTSFLVKTADGYQLVYDTKAAPTVKLGDKVKVDGIEANHNGTIQITNATVEVVSGGNEYSHPEAVTLDGAAIESYSDVFGYVKVTGTLNIDGNYHNLNFAGTEELGSIAAPTEDLSAFNGLQVEVTGYYLYVSTSATAKYFNILATDVSANSKYFMISPATIDVAAAATSTTISVKSNVAWTAISETDGFTLDKTSGEGDSEIKVSFAANTDTEKAKTAIVKLTTTDGDIAEASREVVVTINQSKASSGNELTIVLDATTGVAFGNLNLNTDYIEAKTVDVNGFSWTFAPTNKFRQYSDSYGNYFLWGKKGAYILMPAVAKKSLKKVTILTGKSASTKVQVGVYDAEGKSIIDGGAIKTLNSQDDEFSWELSGTTANTPYQLRVCSAHNAQFQKLTLVYE